MCGEEDLLDVLARKFAAIKSEEVPWENIEGGQCHDQQTHERNLYVCT